MSGVWWRVTPPVDSEFLVLVVDGRVAACSKSYFYGLFGIGWRWEDARHQLEGAQFTCVMAPK